MILTGKLTLEEVQAKIAHSNIRDRSSFAFDHIVCNIINRCLLF